MARPRRIPLAVLIVTITLALVGSILYYGYSGKFNGHSGTVSALALA
jgi:hypothetical protein